MEKKIKNNQSLGIINKDTDSVLKRSILFDLAIKKNTCMLLIATIGHFLFFRSYMSIYYLEREHFLN